MLLKQQDEHHPEVGQVMHQMESVSQEELTSGYRHPLHHTVLYRQQEMQGVLAYRLNILPP